MPFDALVETEQESQVVRDLRAALELLGPNGERWCKHTARSGVRGQYRYCVSGAVYEATGGRWCGDCMLRLYAGWRFHAASHALIRTAPAGAEQTVPHHNDATRTCFCNIREWFWRAIEAELKRAP